jgi:site-specific recombinase XerD
LAPKSISDYGRLLKEFDAFTGHIDLESALTTANAKAWQQEKRVDGLNAAINATMYLKSFATWACKSGYKCGPEGVSVLFHLKPPKGKKRVRHALTQEQLDAIWKALASPSAPGGARAAALLRVLLATGVKRDETRTLLLKDFQLDAKGRGGLISVRDKPYTDVGARKLRLDPDTVASVQAYLAVRPTYAAKGPEPLLLNKDRIGFTENGFGSWIRRIAEFIEAETGIPWTTEDMRFTSNEERNALIRDPDLREKCSATLESAEGDANLEDVVMAACKILEVRVRAASTPPVDKRSGVPLMQFAFGEPAPAVRLSTEAREQSGAERMYAGLMGFYRNRAIHEVRRDLDQRAARQIVLWIDHLLTLLDEASLSRQSVV